MAMKYQCFSFLSIAYSDQIVVLSVLFIFSQKDLNRNDETLSFYYLINVIIIMFKKHVVEEIEV
ncbi:hypothetical protein B6D17_05655 [Gilliamella apis]|uniref:Uncharacterized protein n=1 Tax=Gilliamella apis TaxID=1970738 RepID=A0A242NUE9_9GAMM|nr:hypothetical protein B6C84_07095 [Gilliamella apis]OTQ38633.1 hypothetical protein B6C88_00520 [Gilliamella apis]OTQ39143.1 hypothetical protein B6D26_10065 [Gilliamella apis]OTQ42449.1 hypothetical protein B6C94_07165 [Gilliamella apis]OTQ45084.1 hypothetical protein B6C86_08635 [Gilliamella apis]